VEGKVMSNVEHMKKTVKKNWNYFRLLNECEVFKCSLAELREKLGLPIINCHCLISNLDEAEKVVHDAYDKFENYLLPARAIALLKILNRKERYFPEIDDELLMHVYLRMREFVEKKGNVSSAVLDPFWRSVLKVIDLSSPDAPIILAHCWKSYFGQGMYSSSPFLETQELMRQNLTPSHIKLFLVIELGRLSFNNVFCRDLGKISKKFSLGKEWSPFMAMYALTGQIFRVLVPPANVYVESSEGWLKIEIGSRTPQRDMNVMWSLINKRLGSKKRNYLLRNLPRDLKILELSQKKKEEKAKRLDKLGDGDIEPSEIGPETDDGIAHNLGIIRKKWPSPEETKRGKDIVKQARKRLNNRIQKRSSD